MWNHLGLRTNRLAIWFVTKFPHPVNQYFIEVRCERSALPDRYSNQKSQHLV